MPFGHSNPDATFRGKCIFCGTSLPENARQPKKSPKAKVFKKKPVVSAVKMRKCKMMKKPAPIKRSRAPKIKPNNRKPMPIQTSNPRRAATPPQPDREISRVMTTPKLESVCEDCELSPMLKGIVLGLRLGRQYSQELGMPTGGETPSFHLTAADVVQALAQNQAQKSARVSPSSPNTPLEQISSHTPVPSLVSSLNGNMPPVSAQQLKEICTSGQQEMERIEPNRAKQPLEFSRQMEDDYFNPITVIVLGNQSDSSGESINQSRQEMEQIEPNPNVGGLEFSRQIEEYLGRCPKIPPMSSVESLNELDTYTQWSEQLSVPSSSQSTFCSVQLGNTWEEEQSSEDLDKPFD